MSFFTPQRMMKLGIALCFDLVKFVLALLFLFAPFLACVVGAAAAASYVSSNSWVEGAGCLVAGALTAGLDWFTGGIGAAAIQAGGEVLADAIDFMAWTIFYIWFLTSGTRFLSGKKGPMKLAFGAGGAILGALPFTNIAPTITIGVAGIEWQQYKEDEANAKNKPANDDDPRAARLSMQRNIQAQRAQRGANDGRAEAA